MGARQLLGMVGSDEMRSAVRAPIQMFEGVEVVKAKHPDERQGPGYAVLGRQLRLWLYSGIPASFLVGIASMQERREYEGDQASHKTRVTVKFGGQCDSCVDVSTQREALWRATTTVESLS